MQLQFEEPGLLDHSSILQFYIDTTNYDSITINGTIVSYNAVITQIDYNNTIIDQIRISSSGNANKVYTENFSKQIDTKSVTQVRFVFTHRSGWYGSYSILKNCSISS